MEVRTDLALEDRELRGDFTGGVQEREQDGCRVTTLTVGASEESIYHKPRGTYITIEMKPLSDHIDSDNAYCTVLAQELGSLLPEKGMALVAGLGNRSITPDALGPKTAEQVLATRHITGELEKLTGHAYFRPVVSVSPNVLGNTGMEALEVLESLIRQLHPAVVIVVDALASRSLGRLGCTVQLSDAGIAPGSGVGNSRPAINAETLGVPVIAMGVPTVVDAVTLAGELLEESGGTFDRQIEQAVSPRGAGMIVTPREIDLLIDRASHLVAMAINTSLNPFFDVDTFAALV
ncbi:MAG: GPR endopeptidase [Oscillospiraceae bacterium]|nr:GPR endopeptidase [Oscillospiraceae bacterium]